MTDSTNAQTLWRGSLLPLGCAAAPDSRPRHATRIGKGVKGVTMLLCGALLSACAIGPDYKLSLIHI